MNGTNAGWMKRFGRQQGFLPPGLFDALHQSTVFIPGLGAIGSAVVQALARVGVGNFILIDPDVVGLENVASQIFATTSTVGESKAKVGKRLIAEINPDAQVKILPLTTDIPVLEAIMRETDVAVLGMDSLSGGVACYRAALQTKTPVVDFFYFPTPNVVSTYPGDPIPEERFGYPTRNRMPDVADRFDMASESLLRVMAYGFACNPGLYATFDDSLLSSLRGFLRFEGAVPSFFPLTMETGVLMAREAIAAIAHVHGIAYPRIGWPAFYLDTFRGQAAKPPTPYLSEMNSAGHWMDVLLDLKK